MECISVWLQKGGELNHCCYFWKVTLLIFFQLVFFLDAPNHPCWHQMTPQEPRLLWIQEKKKIFLVECLYLPSSSNKTVSGTALHTWTYARISFLYRILKNCLMINDSHWQGSSGVPYSLDDILIIVSSSASSHIIYNPSVYVHFF